jgi:hypothetical protein
MEKQVSASAEVEDVRPGFRNGAGPEIILTRNTDTIVDNN